MESLGYPHQTQAACFSVSLHQFQSILSEVQRRSRSVEFIRDEEAIDKASRRTSP